MKTNTTPEQINLILKALEAIHVRPFRQESCDPKYDAQRNLSGKTHYVDDDTLRWHKSRILGTCRLHDGLLFRVTCSDSLDMHNTKRGFRCVVFDVFGTTIDRPKLDEATATKQAAIHKSERQEIDLMAHYMQAIQSQMRNAKDRASELEASLNMLEAVLTH